MCAIAEKTVRPARAEPAARPPCVTCKAAPAAEMNPRCGACHARHRRAAYSGPVHADLRRCLALAKELSDLAEDVADRLPGSRLGRFMGGADVLHACRDLRAVAWAADYASGCIDANLFPDPADGG